MNDHDKPMLDDAALDAMFGDAKADAQPTDDLTARVLADAAVALAVPERAVRDSLWTSAVDALGGWPSLGGLATAAIAGVYVGFADPTVLEAVGFGEVATATDVLLSDDAFFEDATLGEG